jgi:hypothetical protein
MSDVHKRCCLTLPQHCSAVGNYNERLLKLAAKQHLVVGREQLLEFGDRHEIEYRLRTGMLERVYESAYKIAGSPDTWRQRLMAATFAGGKTSVASFQAAAQLHYLPGGEEMISITSPRNRRARHAGIKPHESHHLTDLDVMYVDNIPVTRAARTINDLGLLVEQRKLEPAVLDHAMHDAVRRGIVDVQRVVREFERLGGMRRPGAHAVEAMLTNFVPPLRQADTSPELKLLQLVRAAGFPEPVPQYRVWLSPTKWVDLDLAWPWLKIYIEFDSYKYHGDWNRYMKTIRRRLLLQQADWNGVPVTDEELDSGARLALAVLHQLMKKAS